MKILLLEDEGEKAQDIISFFQKIKTQYKQVHSSKDAKQELNESKYEIVIVDLKVPKENAKGNQDIRNGLSFIQYIFESLTFFNRPRAVIVLTEYVGDVRGKLNIFPVAIIEYSRVNKNWRKCLEKRINYYQELAYDVVIITAVDVEFNAFREVDKSDWKENNNILDFVYYESTQRDCKDETIKIALVKQRQKGLVSAVDTTNKVIQYLHPKTVIMSGICAGQKNLVNIGDIIISIKAWDYGSGSIESEGEKYDKFSLIPEPDFTWIGKKMETLLTSYSQKKSLVNELIGKDSKLDKLQSELAILNPSIRVGDMASGAAVIKSEYFVKQFIREKNKKFLGIDMETYGMYYAMVHNRNEIPFFSVKTVSDYGDEEKNKKFQEFCAGLSTQLVLYYLNHDYRQGKII